MISLLVGFLLGGSVISGGVLSVAGYRWYRSGKETKFLKETPIDIGHWEKPPIPILAEASQNCMDRAVELGEYMIAKFEHRGGYDLGIKDKLDLYAASKDMFNSLKEKDNNEKTTVHSQPGPRVDLPQE